MGTERKWCQEEELSPTQQLSLLCPSVLAPRREASGENRGAALRVSACPNVWVVMSFASLPRVVIILLRNASPSGFLPRALAGGRGGRGLWSAACAGPPVERFQTFLPKLRAGLECSFYEALLQCIKCPLKDHVVR